MKPKLIAREAFVLYGLILVFLYGFYLVGLLVGKTHFVEARAEEEPISVPQLPAQPLEPQLQFYQRLLSPEANSPVKPRADAARENSRESYVVQVGAFVSEGDAQKLLTRLEGDGYPARLVHPSSDDQYYRVWVGRFPAESEALRMEERLRRDGFLTYVKKIREP